MDDGKAIYAVITSPNCVLDRPHDLWSEGPIGIANLEDAVHDVGSRSCTGTEDRYHTLDCNDSRPSGVHTSIAKLLAKFLTTLLEFALLSRVAWGIR